jgi:hypothetical protein
MLDVTKLTLSLEELQSSVGCLLKRASDTTWEQAPKAASDALRTLAQSVESLEQTIQRIRASLDTVGRPTEPGTPAVRKRSVFRRLFARRD